MKGHAAGAGAAAPRVGQAGCQGRARGLGMRKGGGRMVLAVAAKWGAGADCSKGSDGGVTPVADSSHQSAR